MAAGWHWALALMVLAVVLTRVIPNNGWRRFQEEELQGQRVILTGGSQGIGFELMQLYCRNHAQVVLAARRTGPLNDAAKRCQQLGGTPYVVAGDLAEEARAQALVATAAEHMGGIDTVILNHVAGYWGNWLTDMADNNISSHLEWYFGVNTYSYIYVAAHALPYLEATNGRLAVVSSAAGLLGLPRVATYAATKHALHGFFNSLRFELAERASNISMTLAILGSIDTTSARENTHGEIDHIPRVSAADTARAIATGVQRRQREVFYPFAELYATRILAALVPEGMQRILQYTILGQ